jgi:hypothetical protein
MDTVTSVGSGIVPRWIGQPGPHGDFAESIGEGIEERSPSRFGPGKPCQDTVEHVQQGAETDHPGPDSQLPRTDEVGADE